MEHKEVFVEDFWERSQKRERFLSKDVNSYNSIFDWQEGSWPEHEIYTMDSREKR